MISYWGSPDYDTALLLVMASGNRTSGGELTPEVRRCCCTIVVIHILCSRQRLPLNCCLKLLCAVQAEASCFDAALCNASYHTNSCVVNDQQAANQICSHAALGQMLRNVQASRVEEFVDAYIAANDTRNIGCAHLHAVASLP